MKFSKKNKKTPSKHRYGLPGRHLVDLPDDLSFDDIVVLADGGNLQSVDEKIAKKVSNLYREYREEHIAHNRLTCLTEIFITYKSRPTYELYQYWLDSLSEFGPGVCLAAFGERATEEQKENKSSQTFLRKIAREESGVNGSVDGQPWPTDTESESLAYSPHGDDGTLRGDDDAEV